MKITSESLLYDHLYYELSIEKNSLIWAHIGIKGLGVLDQGLETITSSFKNVIKDGSLVVPTFSYSWCNNATYDKNKLKNKELGAYSNYIIANKQFIRNSNPNFSVSIMDNTEEKIISTNILDKKTSLTCFGNSSVFNAMYEYSKSNPAYILLLGGAHDDVVFRTTFLHYVEEKVGVPYRYLKKFYNPNDNTDHVEQYVRYRNLKEYKDHNNKPPSNEIHFPIQSKYKKLGDDLFNENILINAKFQYSTSRMVPMYKFCNWLEKKIIKDPYYLIY